MEIPTFVPREIIEEYDFSSLSLPDGYSISEVKFLLTVYFNDETLHHYKSFKTFLSPLTIYRKIPEALNQIKEIQLPKHLSALSNSSSPTPPPSSSSSKINRSKAHWTTNPEIVARFSNYIRDHYDFSPLPSTKVNMILKGFAAETGLEVGSVWSPKLETIFSSLNIKVERIVDPRYPKSAGTYHVYLMGRNKDSKDKKVEEKVGKRMKRNQEMRVKIKKRSKMNRCEKNLLLLQKYG